MNQALKRLWYCAGTLQFRRIWREVHLRLFRLKWNIRWKLCGCDKWKPPVFSRFNCNPIVVASGSNDYIHPKGAMSNNSTNRYFIHFMDILMDELGWPSTVLDLGCAGGQMIADFMCLGWEGVGVEGSDYQSRMYLNNWPRLECKNLFLTDITKHFQITNHKIDFKFHLITAWEVLEHIHYNDLTSLFINIDRHLAPGGLFIASTSDESDIHEGVELHQTRWNNSKWKSFIKFRCPFLEEVDLGLKPHHFVRQCLHNPSFLTYRKKK